jgi:hypothetical protein
MSEVGSRKLFENDRVCVWELALSPGETSAVHRHTRDYVLYVLQGAPVEVFDKDLNSLGRGEVKTGDTVFYRLEGDAVVSDIVTLPATHAFKNLSNDTYREMLVEIK